MKSVVDDAKELKDIATQGDKSAQEKLREAAAAIKQPGAGSQGADASANPAPGDPAPGHPADASPAHPDQ